MTGFQAATQTVAAVQEQRKVRAMIEKLAAAARDGKGLMDSDRLWRNELAPREIVDAAAYIRAHGDHSAYLILFAVREQAPDVYGGLPADVRARVLCDALAHLTYLNDWGYLAPDESHDGEAAKALLALGAAAIAPLKVLLADERAAPLFGTEEATLGHLYKYRRKDFAYRYLSLLLGRKAEFDADPKVRDARIADLAGKAP